MAKYALYNNKVYPLNIRDNQFRLRSTKREKGFHELVDLSGKKHNDIFIKEVTIEELELVYELEFKIVYKGREYEPFSIGNSILNNNILSLFSSDYTDIEIYGFEKKEQFVFKKDVSVDEIDALIEIKKPILKFEGQQESRAVIPKSMIREFIKNLD